MCRSFHSTFWLVPEHTQWSFIRTLWFVSRQIFQWLKSTVEGLFYIVLIILGLIHGTFGGSDNQTSTTISSLPVPSTTNAAKKLAKCKLIHWE